jgi:hypothetical protein
MNDYDEIMTENLTKCFVDHRNVGLAPQIVAEFPLHHAKGGFDVGPLVRFRLRHVFVLLPPI